MDDRTPPSTAAFRPTATGSQLTEPRAAGSQASGTPADSPAREGASRLEYRVDGAHRDLTPPPVPETLTAPPRPARRDSGVLQQASQMLEQLQLDLAEQERRENLLAAREAALLEQSQAFDTWSQRIRGELEERREALLSNESALTARLSSLDERLRELEHQRELIDADRAAADSVRQALELELANERTELTTLRQQVADEYAQLDLERARLQSEHAEQQQQAAARLEEERQQLWSALTSEWQQHREAFESERAAWELHRAMEQNDISLMRDRYDSALQGLDIQLTNRRAAAEAEHQHQLDEVQREIAEARAEWEATQQSLLADQQKERVLAETRLRFQQEHLDKVRADLEVQQQELRQERQQIRQQLEDDSQQLERRREQLKLFQQTLDEQQQSLDRERDTLLKCRQAWDSTVDADREGLQMEQQAWEEARRRQQLELQSQRDSLTNLSESLERKRARLEKLRHELEDTHRTTLELRLSVEEAWAQIADAVGGEEEARLRVDQARQALVLYYQELHAALTTQREELLDQQTRFDQQRLAFHDERQTLLNWLSERDEHLRSDEERVRQDAAAVSVRETEWRRKRDQWLAEKLEAETLIRRLLAEMGERSDGGRAFEGLVTAANTASSTAAVVTAAEVSQLSDNPRLQGPHFTFDRLLAMSGSSATPSDSDTDADA